MDPLLISPCVYVLKCECDNYYIGITYHFNSRMAQHMIGTGATWTRLHKPISCDRVIINGNKRIEDDVTLEYMRKYGVDKVRGGRWCRTTLTRAPIANK